MSKELMELSNELNEAAGLIAKEVKKIVEKDDLTPQELESLYKAACVVEKLSKADGEEGSSRGFGHKMYNDDWGWDSRSPVTGRYVSRGMGGYSGHSIEDRMIAALEDQMDACKNDYERQLIEKEIQRIRMGTR